MKILFYIYLASWLILIFIFLYSKYIEKEKSKDKEPWWVNVLLLAFAPIVVVAVPFILYSDAKKEKANRLSSDDKKLMGELENFLYGGPQAFKDQVYELYNLLGKSYRPEQIANTLTWMTTRFRKEGDKSEYALVDEGQMNRPSNPFSRSDAAKIYRFVAEKQFRRAFPNASQEEFEAMFASFGNNAEGCTTDVVPGAYGEFGYDLTNPIPTRGVPSNETYLRRLRLHSGEKFKWERIGSFGAPNIKNPIDGYKIVVEDGESLCTIYISPYQRVISNQAPKGFYLV